MDNTESEPEKLNQKNSAGKIKRGRNVMFRENTRVVRIGDREIGGGSPVLIQSMCNTKTEDVKATTGQILALERAGCDIIRVEIGRAHV